MLPIKIRHVGTWLAKSTHLVTLSTSVDKALNTCSTEKGERTVNRGKREEYFFKWSVYSNYTVIKVPFIRELSFCLCATEGELQKHFVGKLLCNDNKRYSILKLLLIIFLIDNKSKLVTKIYTFIFLVFPQLGIVVFSKHYSNSSTFSGDYFQLWINMR